VTQHGDLLYVALMRDEICGVLSAVEGRSREEFIADETCVLAAALHFTRLAERPLKASPGYRAAHPEIPWEDLAHVRERVEPELFHDDVAAMWDIAAGELPAILGTLEALLPPDDLWRYRKGAENPDDEAAWPAVEPDVTPRIPIPVDALTSICRRYDVRRIRFFGSVLRDDFGPDSDVDMIVDFGPGAPRGWGIFRFDEELSELLGRRADVLHGQPVRYIRDQILAEAKTIYVAPDATKTDNEAGA
jgi:predicted nucleotidyltransferase/uncharacterized protein with HEPN domain